MLKHTHEQKTYAGLVFLKQSGRRRTKAARGNFLGERKKKFLTMCPFKWGQLHNSTTLLGRMVFNGYGGCMRKPILTPLRKNKLADYCLNISVASFAVAAFGDKWWGVVPAFIFLVVFFILTEE